MVGNISRPLRRFSSVVRSGFDPIVQNGLCLTPSQMERMRQLGQPISAPQLNALEYADDNPHWMEPAPEHKRGADFGSLWEMRLDAAAKARAGRQHQVEIVEPQSVS